MAEPSVRKTRYRYRRRHTPHYYLVIASVFAAALVCVLNIVGYKTGSVRLADVCFASIVVANATISSAFFWGFYMVMNGHIPVKKLKVLVPHAMVGVLSPVLYTLNISINLEGLGVQAVSAVSLACSFACLGLLSLQCVMGRAIVRPEPLRVLARPEFTERNPFSHEARH